MSLRNLIIIVIAALIIFLYAFVEPWIAMLVFGFAVLIGGLVYAFYIAVKVPGGFDDEESGSKTS